MEIFRRIQRILAEEGGLRNIPIERVYGQFLKYHQELRQLFAPQSTLSPPRLIMFEPGVGIRPPKGMPARLDREEAEEMTIFINTYLPFGSDAFYAPKYDGVFICRGGLNSQKRLDEILAEEAGHHIVQLPKDHVSLTIKEMETLNGPMPDFGKKMVANLKTHPPLSRLVGDNWYDPYPLSTNEFFAPLFLTHLTRQDFSVIPEYFTQGRLDESGIEHLPYLAGKMLVTQYHGDVAAIISDHPQLTQLDGKQFWDQYCLPILTRGMLLL
ncbi:hypothetical protein A2617_00935 [Candidatus Daviesbacteria bacterium RIFOXYD1_FULL_41_10]|uniref:Uncharacterized protein n=2 Tax=Candidatus Daviesiibacteriota TaxID=1752718 RepID=A0A1F5N2D3_9BACT|nr:MAG: hypothetical protein A2617_00935 [Candidatus Daviesbacteria bacterium RIFOXYD1_FULL_41_10]